MRFRDRREAGQRLAAALRQYADQDDVLVLALPRGGVPVAAEVAEALRAPLDLMLVRKLGTPGHEELAMGAIASGGAIVFNEDLLLSLGIDRRTVDAVIAREQAELARRDRAYRGTRPPPEVRGRTVLLVDDGLATGATMRAAVQALRRLQPARAVVAVPVAPPDTVERLRSEADEVVVLRTPEPFFGVGNWYEDFSQTSDEEVKASLARHWSAPSYRRPGGGAGEPHGRQP